MTDEAAAAAADGHGALVAADKALALTGYAAYALLLVLLVLCAPGLLLRCIAVPGASFLLVSIVRRAIDAPRPYEVSPAPPLIPKKTRGRSFPSRHAFSMFMVALAWGEWARASGGAAWWAAVAAVALCICGAAVCVVRVRARVHHVRDVAAGAVCALALSAIGYGLIPW